MRRARCAVSCCGSTWVCGPVRAVPCSTMPQPFSVPTMVSAAGLGWAQPFAQPEMWIVPDQGSRTVSAISLAIARAAMNAEAQAGAPGHATMRRRGSSARVTKPSRSASRVIAVTLCSTNPTNNNARLGPGRTARAPCAAAHLTRAIECFCLRVAERKSDAERAAFHHATDAPRSSPPVLVLPVGCDQIARAATH